MNSDIILEEVIKYLRQVVSEGWPRERYEFALKLLSKIETYRSHREGTADRDVASPAVGGL